MSTLWLILLFTLKLSDWCSAHPIYPLYGIDSVNDASNLTQQDIQIIATNFTFIQASYSTQTLNQMHKINKEFKPVSYINSDACSANELETTDRFGCSYFIIGILTQSISSTDTKLALKLSQNTSYLKASTTNRNYSQSSSSYVTFIRINNELIKIINITSINNNNEQTITKCIRGFDKTLSVSHPANNNIFAPVYNGGGFPGGTRGSLDYVIDPEQSFGKNRLIKHTIEVIQNGFNGSWFDCFSAFQFNAVDLVGNKLKQTWSFQLNEYFTRTTFANSNQQRLTYILNETYKNLSYYPVITANNIAGSYWPNNGNVRSFLEQNKKVAYRTNLNGYSLEQFAGKEVIDDPYSDGCPIDGAGLVLEWQSYKNWLNNVQEVMNASQSNLGIMPMVAQAGCKSICLEVVPADERNEFEQFAYCSFLLGVELMTGNSRLGIPVFYQNENKTLRYAKVHERYFWDIGNPTQTYNYENITNYRQKGKNTFMRYFENGLVLVNPSNITDKNFQLNATYYNPDTMQYVKTLDSVAQRGYILLNNKPKFR